MGPKIRIGDIASGEVALEHGQSFVLSTQR